MLKNNMDHSESLDLMVACKKNHMWLTNISYSINIIECSVKFQDLNLDILGFLVLLTPSAGLEFFFVLKWFVLLKCLSNKIKTYISVILDSNDLKVCFLWSSRCHYNQEAYVPSWVFSFCFMALTKVLISPLGKYYTNTHIHMYIDL